MNDRDLYWLAGWLEGEGSFFVTKGGTSVAIQAFSTDKDVIERVVVLMQCGIYYIKPRLHVAGGWDSKEGWRANLEAQPAVDLMKKLQPLMCARRAEKIAEVLQAWDNRPNRPVEKACACGCGRTFIAGPRRVHFDQSVCGMRSFRARQQQEIRA